MPLLPHIPPLLPDNAVKAKLSLDIPSGLNSQFDHIPVINHFARYLGGGQSLTEARQVSRKRLYLVGSGLPNIQLYDPQATGLYKQINQYVSATTVLRQASTITAGMLCDINAKLSDHDDKGTIRAQQTWIGGGSLANAQYVCPPPDALPDLLNNWLNFVNSPLTQSPENAIIAYARLLSLHPFTDGNGRVARAFLDGAMAKLCGNTLSPLLYRLTEQCDFDHHREALNLLSHGDPAGLCHPFWQDAFQWTGQQQNKIESILGQAKTQLTNKLGLMMVGKAAGRLIEYLWLQPVIAEYGLAIKLGVTPQGAHTALTQLTDCAILHKRPLRQPHNTFVYECSIMIDALAKLDLLFD